MSFGNEECNCYQFSFWIICLVGFTANGFDKTDASYPYSCPDHAKQKLLAGFEPREMKCKSAEEYLQNPCTPYGVWLRTSRKCVRFIPDAMSWHRARSCCQLLNMDLLKILSVLMNQEIKDKFLQFAPRYAWIGLNDLATEGHWVWLNQSVNASFTDWEVGRPYRSVASRDCAMFGFGSERRWQDMACSKDRPLLCQKVLGFTKAPPTVAVDYHQSPHQVFAGWNFTLRCEAYDGNVSWRGLPGREEVHIQPEKRDEDICKVKHTVVKHVTASPALKDAVPQCCASYFFSWSSLCQKTPAIQVVPAPDVDQLLMPTLRIHYHQPPNVLFAGGALHVTCGGYVPRGAELLFLSSTGDSGEVLISAEKPAVISLTSASDGRWLRLTDTTEDVGWRSNLTLRVTGLLQGNFIKCCRPRTDTRKAYCHYWTTKFKVIFNAQQPKLQDIKFDSPPRTVIGGRNLEYKCSAFVGSAGLQAWELTTERSSSRWLIDLQENVVIEGSILGAHVSSRQVTVDQEWGPFVTSTLAVQASTPLENATLSCLTLNNRSTGWTDIFNNSHAARSSISSPFVVLFIPQIPKLRVKRIKSARDSLSPGRIEATCTAHVGVSGVLTWALARRNIAQLWIVGLDGRIYFTNATSHFSAKVLARVDLRNETHGPLVESTLVLELMYIKRSSTLLCYSYNSSGNENHTDSRDRLRSSYHITVSKIDYSPFLTVREVALAVMLIWVILASCMIMVGFRKEDASAEEDYGVFTSGNYAWLLKGILSRSNSLASLRRFRSRTTSVAVTVGAPDNSICDTDNMSEKSARRKSKGKRKIKLLGGPASKGNDSFVLERSPSVDAKRIFQNSRRDSSRELETYII